MNKIGRWDLERLGVTHSRRMLRTLKLLGSAGDEGMSISKITDSIYDGDTAQMSKCRHLWETAINDLGIIGMVKHKVTRGVFHHYITLEGKLFLEEHINTEAESNE